MRKSVANYHGYYEHFFNATSIGEFINWSQLLTIEFYVGRKLDDFNIEGFVISCLFCNMSGKSNGNLYFVSKWYLVELKKPVHYESSKWFSNFVLTNYAAVKSFKRNFAKDPLSCWFPLTIRVRRVPWMEFSVRQILWFPDLISNLQFLKRHEAEPEQ